MRLPPTDCCPTHAIICEMFRGDPFDPHSAMILGLHGDTYMRSKIKQSIQVKRIPPFGASEGEGEGGVYSISCVVVVVRP